MDRAQLTEWLEGYERAWRSPGNDSLAELFSDDATYSTGPYERPHRGLDAIARMWDAERLGPDEAFEISSEIVAVEGDTGVARIAVRYGAPKGSEYRDLWIIRLDHSGRCFRFEEWPFWPPGQEGAPAAGAD
ncbi:MAG TPA: nuclear transport factor 2 family protein [Solirubrobacterales bacterium]|nr:nuclear transport factor 2 family protein [Solirubrobacterales bacterium]